MYFSRERLNSFSVKGIRDLLKTNGVVLFWADLIFLQETHAVMSDFTFWKNQWDSDKLLVYRSNDSAEIAFFKGNYIFLYYYYYSIVV